MITDKEYAILGAVAIGVDVFDAELDNPEIFHWRMGDVDVAQPVEHLIDLGLLRPDGGLLHGYYVELTEAGHRVLSKNTSTQPKGT